MLDRRTVTPDNEETPPPDAPLPVRGGSLLAPFSVRSFRFQWPADLATSSGFEMEMLVLGWFVLVETGSVLWLTVWGSVLYLGTLVAPLFGVAGDRIGHRDLLFAMRGFYMALAVTVLTLAFLGALTPLIVVVISALMGLVRPSDLGVRGALVADTMPSGQLIGAISMSRTTADGARIVGALTGAGLFAAFGVGPAYIAITACYALGALLTLGVAKTPRSHAPVLPDPAAAPPRTSPWRDLKEGMAYVWTTPRLLAAMWLAFLVNLTAFPLSNGLLPYVARNVYHIDQTGLGYLVASFAGGALIGALVLTRMGGDYSMPRVMIYGSLAWYALLIVFAQIQGFVGGVVLLTLAGIAQSLSMVALSIMLMHTSGSQFRGRVMGVRMMVIYSLPFGLLAAGALIEHIGYHTTATIYAVFGLVFTALIALRWRADLWRG